MKVLFNCHLPFMLAHSGMQVQIEQIKAALEKTGVTVVPLSSWDETQRGDVLQHLAGWSAELIRLGQQEGMKVVMLDLLTEQGSRPTARLKLQKRLRQIMELVRANREAPDFVRLSKMDTLSLSSFEAAAGECRLLPRRLSWAMTVFRENACYCPAGLSAARTAGFLRQFFDAAPGLPPAQPPPRSLRWDSN